MKIIAENFLDLGDAGQHQVTAVGDCQSNGGQVHCIVEPVSVEVKGSPAIELWPLLKINGMADDIRQWLIDAYDCRCKSVIEAIRKQEYLDRMEARCEL